MKVVTLTRGQAIAQLDASGLAPRRSLGQNFVVDANTVRRIARLAEVGPGSSVVEVGAGLGSLTLALAETGAEIVAVEIDNHLVPLLCANTADLPNVRVVHADAMTTDWHALLASAPTWVLVANLPYNIATPLVADLLDEVHEIASMLVMVQQEVAQRLVAAPRTAAYGAVSVKVAYWASASIVGVVPPSVFHPRPNVDSALVRITRRSAPALDATTDRTLLFELVRAGFAHRRKMLRGALAERVDADTFLRAGVEPTARAEELDVMAWGRLARAVKQS